MLFVEVLHRVLRLAGRRVIWIRLLTRRAHRSFQILVGLIALNIAVRVSGAHFSWHHLLLHLLDLSVIGAGSWLLTKLLFVVEDRALARFRTDVRDNRQARTVHTQVRLVRRLTAAVATVGAGFAMALTFHQVQKLGSGLAASAGVTAAVVAFAGQALLGNVVAGLQLAFGKALRLGDVVVLKGEWGWIEEITLTYVVVHAWDDRRVIVPTSYFTTTPFQNWTHAEASLMGQVEMEVDWTAPVDEMRTQMRAILGETDLWDKRVGVLQVVEAIGPYIKIRVLVSAEDAGALWDLRCLLRERLVGWLRVAYPGALPRHRTEVGEARRRPPEEPLDISRPDEGSLVFGGSREGRGRRRALRNPAEHPPQGTLPEDHDRPMVVDPTGFG
ncbi:MAG: mechanosensitive ion channel [Micromonosporaceae bacterium]|nr:mechanosensitive ion channel [Micromonosporaceae bacterium]